MADQQHNEFIRRAIKLAELAVEHGNHPFGALLVHNGKIILEAENTVNTDKDPTGHAETNLVRSAGKKISPEVLRESILYTSTEPCMMCSGAMYWGGISHVVYCCSETTLAKYAGDDFLTPCREVFAKGKARTVKVEGPFLEDEGAPLHAKYWPNLLH
jgi:tRNA(Arg) A34 adenosine deaminase TadA